MLNSPTALEIRDAFHPKFDWDEKKQGFDKKRPLDRKLKAEHVNGPASREDCVTKTVC